MDKAFVIVLPTIERDGNEASVLNRAAYTDELKIEVVCDKLMHMCRSDPNLAS